VGIESSHSQRQSSFKDQYRTGKNSWTVTSVVAAAALASVFVGKTAGKVQGSKSEWQKWLGDQWVSKVVIVGGRAVSSINIGQAKTVGQSLGTMSNRGMMYEVITDLQEQVLRASSNRTSGWTVSGYQG
jgi:hypothetical protein